MRQYEKIVFLTQYYGVCLWSETAAVTYRKIMNDAELEDIDETRRAGAEMLYAKRAATIFSTMAQLLYAERLETLDWKDMEAELQKIEQLATHDAENGGYHSARQLERIFKGDDIEDDAECIRIRPED